MLPMILDSRWHTHTHTHTLSVNIFCSILANATSCQEDQDRFTVPVDVHRQKIQSEMCVTVWTILSVVSVCPDYTGKEPRREMMGCIVWESEWCWCRVPDALTVINFSVVQIILTNVVDESSRRHQRIFRNTMILKVLHPKECAHFRECALF